MASVEQAALTVVEEVVGLLDLDEFHRGLLHALRATIPSDWASVNDIGAGPGDVVAVVVPEIPGDMLPIFVQLRDENPLIQRYARTRDGRAYRFSDVVSPADLHARRLYREFYRPLGVEHQMAFTLPAGPDRILGVALSRGGSDYTDHERDVLNRCRPLLIQVFRNAIAHRQVVRRLVPDPAQTTRRLAGAGLSPRQSEVLALVTGDVSRPEIARRLGISERTVSKHLQIAYRTLGVSGRGAAAERAARLLDPEASG